MGNFTFSHSLIHDLFRSSACSGATGMMLFEFPPSRKKQFCKRLGLTKSDLADGAIPHAPPERRAFPRESQPIFRPHGIKLCTKLAGFPEHCLAPATDRRVASGCCLPDWLAALSASLCLVASGSCQPWAVGTKALWSFQALTRNSVSCPWDP